MDLKEIQNLIKFVAKSGATEVKLEMDDFKITIKTIADGSQAEAAYVQMPISNSIQQVGVQPVSTIDTVKETVEIDSKYVTIKSPIIGTFYRKPSPDKSPFVEVGNIISKGDILCVIEAMKLFNEIESEVSGKIIKVLVDDASPIEFDQPLFLVDPS